MQPQVGREDLSLEHGDAHGRRNERVQVIRREPIAWLETIDRRNPVFSWRQTLDRVRAVRFRTSLLDEPRAVEPCIARGRERDGNEVRCTRVRSIGDDAGNRRALGRQHDFGVAQRLRARAEIERRVSDVTPGNGHGLEIPP